jgi:hypothetical protein
MLQQPKQVLKAHTFAIYHHSPLLLIFFVIFTNIIYHYDWILAIYHHFAISFVFSICFVGGLGDM